jgi:esterase/lipase superfamily enzyme
MERGALVDFDGEQNSQLNFGVCEVIVPEGHRIGSIGSPLWKRLLNKSDDRLRVDSLISLNQDLFFKHISEVTRRMKDPRKLTIFVHGFNNTFSDAVRRAAQIGFDLGLGQGMGLFSWPSKGSFVSYNADADAAEASKYPLADFIENFVNNTQGDGVNIIAHSMGCRCLLGALEVLSSRRIEVLKSIDEVILAAADVNSAIMPHLGRHAVENCARTTSYVSDKDTALKISGWLHRFPRVGVMPPTYVLRGMDTVLVNDMDLRGFSHGYVGTSRVILNDIFALLKENAAPENELLSNLVFKDCWSCSDLAIFCGFNSVFERDACDDFCKVIKAA